MGTTVAYGNANTYGFELATSHSSSPPYLDYSTLVSQLVKYVRICFAGSQGWRYSILQLARAFVPAPHEGEDDQGDEPAPEGA